MLISQKNKKNENNDLNTNNGQIVDLVKTHLSSNKSNIIKKNLNKNKHTNKKINGQIAIEFLLIAGIAFGIIFIFLIGIYRISEDNTTIKTYAVLQDFGSALQKELLVASEVENGYKRKINIPETINGLEYNITIYNSTKYTYMIITYKNIETYYAIPTTEGFFAKGTNYILKNNTVYITQS